jgi:protein TonB
MWPDVDGCIRKTSNQSRRTTMFDVIVGRHPNPAPRDIVPMVISWAVHTILVGTVVVLPLLFATDHLPAVPKEVLTYVPAVATPPPPPPPPPAAMPAAKQDVARPASRPAPTPRPVLQAPSVVPRELPPPVAWSADEEALAFDAVDAGFGGVPGGVPGGLFGGVVGGVAEVPMPPPPAAPPAPVARPPVRTGGQIKAPALVKRVPPVYPPLAGTAQVQGVVILEATVGRDGRVEDVTVLRSAPLLDRAAIDAVRQWIYDPLLLNGKAERFVLTVTVSFSRS